MSKIPARKEKDRSNIDNEPMTFGKYRGKTPEEVSEIDGPYLVWAYQARETKPCSEAMYNLCTGIIYHDAESDFQKEIAGLPNMWNIP